MSSAIDDYEALPFPPGTSPFHVKGLVYRQHVEYARDNVPGGEAAVLDAFRDPALRAFYDRPFLAASWYDALPLIPVWYVCARLLGRPAVEFLRARTRHQAEHDIHTVYRLILKIASAETVALRMPRVLAQYFDFGSSEATVVRPGVVRLHQSGTHAILAPWLTVVGDTYLRVAMEIAGVPEVQLKRAAPVSNGTAHGVPLVTLGVEVQYA